MSVKRDRSRRKSLSAVQMSKLNRRISVALTPEQVKTLDHAHTYQALGELPPAYVIEEKWNEIKDELNLPASANMEPSAKWMMILQYSRSTPKDSEEVNGVLKTLGKGRKGLKPKHLVAIRTMLTGKPVTWVKLFVVAEGVELIFSIVRECLKQKKIDEREAALITESIKCLKGVMNTDSASFDRVLQVEDGLYLLIQSIPYLSTIAKCELFEFLAVVCFKRDSKIVTREIQKVGYEHIVDSLRSKSHDLRVSTMLLLNGLMCGTTDSSVHTQIAIGLEKAGFVNAFAAIKDEYPDSDQWNTQVRIFEQADAERQESPDAQMLKMAAKVKEMETEIDTLYRKNMKLAEEKEAAIMGLANHEIANLRSQLRDKDEFILKMETEIASLKMGGATSNPMANPLGIFDVFAGGGYGGGAPGGAPSDLPPPPAPGMDMTAMALMGGMSAFGAFGAFGNPFAAFGAMSAFGGVPGGIPPPIVGGSAPSDLPPPPPGSDTSSGPPSGLPPPPGGMPPPGAIGSSPSIPAVPGAPVPGPSGGPPPPAPGGGPPPPPPAPGGGPPPPPPGPGGPPPPPGPGGPPPPGAAGMLGDGMVPKKKIVPGKKMKALNWNKIIPRSIKGTVWATLDDEKIKLNGSELEDFFGITEAPSKKKDKEDKEGGESKPEKPTVVNLLDNKRSNNVMIMLRGLKMNHLDVKKSLEDMDEENLSLDGLTAVANFLPTADEIKLLESYEGDRGDLGDAEKYFLAIGSIPLLNSRVATLQYKKTFDSKFKEGEESLNTLTQAANLAKTSKKFHNILELVLALGNYINGNTVRGGVYGFKLESLSQLRDMRGNNNVSLLTYFVGILEKDYPELLKVIPEFEVVKDAQRENMQESLAEINKLVMGLTTIKAQLASVTCDAKFKAKLEPFVPIAQQRLEALVKTGQNLQKTMVELLTFYGEGPSTKTETFFGLIADFVISIDKAIIENKKKKEAEEKKKHQLARSPSGKNLHAVASSTALPQTGEIDRMIGDMKNGKLFQLKKEAQITNRNSKGSQPEIPAEPIGPAILKKRNSMGDGLRPNITNSNNNANVTNDQFLKELQAKRQARENKLKDETDKKDDNNNNSNNNNNNDNKVDKENEDSPSKFSKSSINSVDNNSGNNSNNTTPQKLINVSLRDSKKETKKSLTTPKDEEKTKVKKEIESSGESVEKKHTPKSKKKEKLDD